MEMSSGSSELHTGFCIEPRWGAESKEPPGHLTARDSKVANLLICWLGTKGVHRTRRSRQAEYLRSRRQAQTPGQADRRGKKNKARSDTRKSEEMTETKTRMRHRN